MRVSVVMQLSLDREHEIHAEHVKMLSMKSVVSIKAGAR